MSDKSCTAEKAMTDKLRLILARLEQRAVRLSAAISATQDGHSIPFLEGELDEVQNEIAGVRAALAAAPQPAPEREALVEVLRPYVGAEMAHAIADALLARGLCLPAPETGPRRCAECTCEGGEHECNWIKPSPSAPETLADVLQEAFNRYASTNEGRPIGEYLAAAVRGQDS